MNDRDNIIQKLLYQKTYNKDLTQRQAKKLFKISQKKKKSERDYRRVERIVGSQKYDEVVQKSYRSQLIKQFTYQKNRAQQAENRTRMYSTEIHKNTKEFFLSQHPQFLDFNFKNKLRFLSNDEIKKLIDEAKQFADERKTKKKLREAFWEDSILAISDSFNRGTVSYEQLVNRLKDLTTAWIKEGFKQKELFKMINKVFKEIANIITPDIENQIMSELKHHIDKIKNKE